MVHLGCLAPWELLDGKGKSLGAQTTIRYELAVTLYVVTLKAFKTLAEMHILPPQY